MKNMVWQRRYGFQKKKHLRKNCGLANTMIVLQYYSEVESKTIIHLLVSPFTICFVCIII